MIEARTFASRLGVSVLEAAVSAACSFLVAEALERGTMRAIAYFRSWRRVPAAEVPASPDNHAVAPVE